MKSEDLSLDMGRQAVFDLVKDEYQVERLGFDPVQIPAQAHKAEAKVAAGKVEIVSKMVKAGEQPQIIVKQGIFFIETELFDGINRQASQAGLAEGVLCADVERNRVSEDLLVNLCRQIKRPDQANWKGVDPATGHLVFRFFQCLFGGHLVFRIIGHPVG